MAITTDHERTRTGQHTAGSSIVVSGDRSKNFRAARRHSIVVRTLRVLFPLASLAVVGVYGWSLMATSGLTSGLPEIPIPKITAQDLTMHNPNYDGFTKDGGTYRVAAKTAQRELSQLSLVKLDSITGTLTDANKSETNLAAERGTFDHGKNILELFDKIDIAGDNGLKAALTQATVLTNEGLITSKQPVRVEFPAGTIQSKQMTLRQKVKEATFLRDVRARLKPPQPPADPAQDQDSANKLFGGSDAPVNINAARLDIKDNEKTAIFTGKVTASQGDAALQTPEMTVIYTGDAVATGTQPNGEAQPVSSDALAGNGKVQRILAKGPVVMTRGPLERVTSQSANFDAENETAVLSGDVVMTSGPDRRAVGDQVDLDQRADTALLTGNVVVTQGLNVLKGRRLFVDRKAGRTQLTSPGGRISTHFAQTAPGKAKQTAAADAPKNDAGFALKTAPGAPLDIEAAQLNVNDTAKVATFSGDVKAKQGDFVITAAELNAHYTGSANLADVGGAAPAPAAKPDEPGAELTKALAKGNVVMTSTDGRKVTGDWAEFDAKSNKAIVGGDEVELYQGRSVIRATRVVIDMITGKTTIDGAPSQTVANPAGQGWVTQAGDKAAPAGNSGRPSAIFFPQELRDGQKKSKAAQPPGPSSGNN
jgi:LPS export ABC transporter protein LptC